MPVRRPLPKTPVVIPRSHYYSTGTTRSSSARHDYAIDDSLNEAEYFSNAVLEDNYDSARKSKSRDNELIRNTRAAIINTEQHASPRASSVSRRVRASTAPPVPRQAAVAQRSQVAQAQQARPPPAPRPRVVLVNPNPPSVSIPAQPSRPVVLVRGGSLPPKEIAKRGYRAASTPPQMAAAPEPELASSTLWAHRPMTLYKDEVRRARAQSVEPPPRVLNYYYPQKYYEEPADKGLPTSHLRAHRPLRVSDEDMLRLARSRNYMRPRRYERATSEPRDVKKATGDYFSIASVRARALSRYLYADRGRGVPRAKRVSLGDFPKVYVPWTGGHYRMPIGCRGWRQEAAQGSPFSVRGKQAA